MVDVIVAGAGIWGCTVARVLAEAGREDDDDCDSICLPK